MRNIRDCFFDKSLSPSRRVHLIWKVVFFLRIWRRRLKDNGRSKKDHFVTNNTYVCVEINAHMMLQLIYNVINGVFPPEVLRVWNTGSQDCEEIFRLLRSMTPTFSTVVNFSVKGILERIHKLNFLSSMECTEKLTFPRVQIRLLQCKDESETTFQHCQIDDIEREIKMAKEQANDIASSCGMCLESYEDTHLLEDVIQLFHNAIDDDGEDEEYAENPAATTTDDSFDNIDPVLIQEDLSNLRLKKSSKPGIPTYEVSVDKGSNISKTYSLQKNKKSPFILYNDKYIRKSTALYLLQENFSVSNDRLLCVRANQHEHVHNLGNNLIYPQDHMKLCDLCVFRRTGDGNKFEIGRVIQFSYLQGTKKNREYSADYVDFSKDMTNIGTRWLIHTQMKK